MLAHPLFLSGFLKGSGSSSYIVSEFSTTLLHSSILTHTPYKVLKSLRFALRYLSVQKSTTHPSIQCLLLKIITGLHTDKRVF